MCINVYQAAECIRALRRPIAHAQQVTPHACEGATPLRSTVQACTTQETLLLGGRTCHISRQQASLRCTTLSGSPQKLWSIIQALADLDNGSTARAMPPLS